MTIEQTYAGLRVLDLSTNIAGPFAAMIFGDMGADVTKVERPPSGDDTRALPPRWNDEATVFIAVNRNKRSLLLDIKTDEGKAALLRMASQADIVIESFPPGLASKLGLTFQDFLSHNPNILVCSISAFGSGALGSKMPGYDALVQAVSGLMSFTGHPDTPPLRIAPSVLDLTTGMWAAMGLMAALARRSSGGGGEHVQSCLLDSALTIMNHQLMGYLATGEEPRKFGSGAPSAAPYGVFAASDGDLMIATASEPQWPRLCTALGLQGLANDSRFATMAARLAHRDELDPAIAAIIKTRSSAHWLSTLSDAGISVGAVNGVRAALDLPITQERQMFVAPEHAAWAGGIPQLRLPIDQTGAGVRRGPPLLGEHTLAVLESFGFTESEIAGLAIPESSRR